MTKPSGILALGKKINVTIYFAPTHPGRLGKRGKVGCTRNLRQRVRRYQKIFGSQFRVEVLEKLTNVTLKQAGDREWYWASKLGCYRGQHYERSYVNGALVSREAQSRGGKTSGPITGPRSGRIQGRRNVESGFLRSISSKGGKASTKSPLHPNNRELTCPHCGKIGRGGIVRWHFNNCRMRKIL